MGIAKKNTPAGDGESVSRGRGSSKKLDPLTVVARNNQVQRLSMVSDGS